VPPFVNRSPYAVPPVGQLPLARAAYTVPFAWGRGDGQVAFAVQGGEGASGGPATFLADRRGEIVLFDHSNARILVRSDGEAPFTRTVDMPSPAVTAAVFDSHARLIAAFYNDLVVFDAQNGATLGSFPGAGPSGPEITRLAVVGSTVYSVAEDGTLTAELHDDGAGYHRAPGNTPLERGAVTLAFHQSSSTLDVEVAGSGRHYTFTFTGTGAAGIADVPAARALPDGSLVLVVSSARHGMPNLDQVRQYEIVRVDATGHASSTRVDASGGYLTNGAEFAIAEDGVAVMSSTATGGVTVSYYPLP
jgi:hypothetical protein